MVDFFDGLRRATRAVDCTLLTAAGAVLGAAGSLPGGDPTFVNNSVKALRRLRGCDPADDPEPEPPGFSGGQCDQDGGGYLVVIEVTRTDGGITTFNRRARGPIGGVRLRQLSTQGVAEMFSHDTTSNQNCNINLPDRGGAWRNLASQSTAFSPAGGATIAITSLTPCPGYPDDCGDAPPTFPPPGDTTINIDVTYNIEEGPDIDVTVPVIFSPFFIDYNGDFNFPIRFNFGDIDFTGNVEFTPQFNFTINPQPGPRGTNNPVDELPEEEPEIPVEPEPPGETVVGVVVQARLIGEQQLTTIATDNIPQILAPRCGSVKFGYRIAGRSYWSPDIDIKDLNCFIPCPFSQGAATVAASPAPGVALDYVPIFGSPLATRADLFSTPEP